MAPKPCLPSVTLACVDTRHPDLAWWALQRCLDLVEVSGALMFAPNGWAPAQHAERVCLLPTEALKGIQDYNRFMHLGLAEHVQTNYVLIMQWDGFITTPSLWSQEFLDWDYIGAPWYHGGSGGVVGNGGFSLRSRKLLLALQSLQPDPSEPEDMAICVTLRPRLEREFGIRFAPLEVAQRFAIEYGPHRPAFGFHGMLNFAHALSSSELNGWLDQAPLDLLCSQHARKLVKHLMQNGRSQAALDLLRRRSIQLGWNTDQLLLAARAWLHRLRSSGR